MGNREIQHPLRSLEEAGAVIGEGMASGKSGAAVWVGEMGIVEREFEPLPLAVADTDAERTPLDESGAGGGGVFVGVAEGKS